MCHSVLEQNANFQLHILIWGMERTLWDILILKRKETQCYFCSYTLSPWSVRICLYFPDHTAPSQQVTQLTDSHLLPWAGSAWAWDRAYLVAQRPWWGGVSPGLPVGGLDSSPSCGRGKSPLMFVWCFLIFPSTYVHSHLLSCVVQWRTRRGRESAHFTEKVNEYPGGSTLLLFLEVRGASTHWLLSLTLSYAALRTTLRNLYGGRGDMGAIFHRDLSGSSQVLCPHSFSTPIQSPGWSSWLSYPVINELSVMQAWVCSGQVKGRSKEMVWMVRSRISHVIEPSTTTCTRQPVSRYLI